MVERGKLNAILAVAAVAILIGSGVALALANAPHGDSNIIIVNGKGYPWERLSDEFQAVHFEANGVQYDGIRISDIVNDTDLDGSEMRNYELVSARDGYSKTVAWEDLLNGFLVFDYEKRAVFPERTKSFWVDTLGEINPVAG
ncbi:MAG: hypothetical protein V1934_02075 [Methanobacteriota archaeon]